ncbi:response regulator transcription factor [Limnobacter humi]|uniref:Response regulator transcription factor n=1 Tax=Limnobacter humi TaxID=1778671 RepID=A0ABT1WFV4_9BURK|nr:response regulator transcription factor [Limnobacter humi]MCQ8895299.1 response regulator transcription factor [Limnobacter humi]
MTCILHIDDDIELGTLLCEYLRGEGFDAEHCANPLDGLNRIQQGGVDLVVLDVMMREQNGLDTLKTLRQSSEVPVLMLTARGDNIDRIVGLELGADDYVPKPCMPREIVARIRAILRRTAESSNSTTARVARTLGPLSLDSSKRKASLNEEPVELTSAEFNVLEVLMSHAGEVVSKALLCEQGLGRKLERFDRSIDVHMSALRNKLNLNATDSVLALHTIRGQGYQLSLR